VTIVQLRYFLRVLEVRSITRAAEILNVAQPALGLQIRNLEAELGARLLVRHSRGVTPTEAGNLLARHAEIVLNAFDRARQDVIDYGKAPKGLVRLGMTATATLILGAALVERCSTQFPGVALHIEEAHTQVLLEGVEADRLDMALVYKPVSYRSLALEALADEGLVFVQPARQGQNGKPIPFAEALRHELVLSSRPNMLREMIDDIARHRDLSLRIFCEVDSVPTKKELVRRDLARSIIPAPAVHEEVASGRLAARPITDPDLSRTLCLAVSSRRPPGKAVEAVSKAVRETVAAMMKAKTAGWSPPR
jgi:LysR family transcriptional regulator, nitrogen assimilation regulatory protein